QRRSWSLLSLNKTKNGTANAELNEITVVKQRWLRYALAVYQSAIEALEVEDEKLPVALFADLSVATRNHRGVRFNLHICCCITTKYRRFPGQYKVTLPAGSSTAFKN